LKVLFHIVFSNNSYRTEIAGNGTPFCMSQYLTQVKKRDSIVILDKMAQSVERVCNRGA
jgi:hypothetical protein